MIAPVKHVWFSRTNAGSTFAWFSDFQMDPVLTAAVIVATAGLVGVIIGVLLVQKGLNRRRILLSSAFGTSVAFLLLSLHFYYKETGK